jgi:hypothetical protein
VPKTTSREPVKKEWRGDEAHMLPAQKVEPYRLWFEFLKLAHGDPDISINKKFYRSWGTVQGEDFSEWWSGHWRTLFAVDIGVRVVDSEHDLAHRSDSDLLVRIPLYQDRARTLRQLSELLESHGAGVRLADMTQGQFHLSVGVSEDGHPIHPSTRFLRNLPKVRLLMHLYRFWLEGQGLDERTRLEQTAIKYFSWADSWNRKVRERNWKRPLIEIPPAISEYVTFLQKRGERKRVRLSELNETDVANHRRQVARYIRKARHIAANVGNGEFPGVYEKSFDGS